MRWLTCSFILQIRERDRFKLFAIKNNSAYCWKAYKLSRNRVTQALREAKSACYKRQFVSVTNNPKQAWKTVVLVFLNKEIGELQHKCPHHCNLMVAVDQYFPLVQSSLSRLMKK